MNKLTKNIVLATSLMMPFSAFAAGSTSTASTGSSSTSSTSIADFYEKMKKSPVSLTYINEIGFLRDKKDKSQVNFDEISMMHYVPLSYKIDKYHSISWVNRWDAKYRKNEATDGNWTYTHLDFYRSSILNQAKHGVNATFHFRQRIYPEHVTKANDNLAARPGYSRAGMIFSRSLTKNLYTSMPVYLAVYQRTTGNEEAELPVSYFYLYNTTSYSFTDKLSMGLTTEYIKFHYKGPKYNDESLDMTLGLDYQVSSQFGVGTSAAVGGVLEAHDNRSGFKKHIDENISYAVNFTAKLF